MNINYIGKDDVRSEALEEICNKKLARLEKRFVNGESQADVNFAMENNDFVLTIQLFIDGDKYIAKAKCLKGPDMYKNIDTCIEKLEAQLRKTKVNKKGAKKPSVE